MPGYQSPEEMKASPTINAVTIEPMMIIPFFTHRLRGGDLGWGSAMPLFPQGLVEAAKYMRHFLVVKEPINKINPTSASSSGTGADSWHFRGKEPPDSTGGPVKEKPPEESPGAVILYLYNRYPIHSSGECQEGFCRLPFMRSP